MQRRSFLRAGLSVGVPLMASFGHAEALEALSLPPRPRPKTPLRLNSNENPLGLAPAGRKALLDTLVDANRYPRNRADLIDALAAKHQVKPEQIVLGAGSTEVLQIVVQAMARPGSRVVVADPTFEDVSVYAAPSDIPVDKIPLRPDFSHDIPRMRAAAEAVRGPVVVFICNPNNPTGTLTRCAEVDEWITAAPANVTFLLDEAYFEFVDDAEYWSGLKWLATKPNVIVSRTFSKIFGMAGLRLGYGIAHPDTSARLRRFASSNSVGNLAMAAGLGSLGDADFARKSLAVNREARQMLYGALEHLKIEYLPSQANFVMHRITGDLQTHIQRMREKEVLVGRAFPPMLNYCRVSIGTTDEMTMFIEVLQGFRKEGWV